MSALNLPQRQLKRGDSLNAMRATEAQAIIDQARKGGRVSVSGRANLANHPRGSHVDVPLPMGAPVTLGTIVAEGPQGQDDFTDEHYWIAPTIIAGGLELEVPVELAMRGVVKALHLGEALAHTHTLLPGTPIVLFRFRDWSNEAGIHAWVFSVGGAGGSVAGFEWVQVVGVYDTGEGNLGPHPMFGRGLSVSRMLLTFPSPPDPPSDPAQDLTLAPDGLEEFFAFVDPVVLSNLDAVKLNPAGTGTQTLADYYDPASKHPWNAVLIANPNAPTKPIHPLEARLIVKREPYFLFDSLALAGVGG